MKIINYKTVFIILVLVSIYFYLNSFLAENYPKSSFKIIDDKIQQNKKSFISRNILTSDCTCRQERVIVDEYENYYRVQVETVNKTVKNFYRVRKSSIKSITCNLYKVLRRGPKQKVIGYSLYGTHLKYYNHLFTNVELATVRYPGWIIRVHYNESIIKKYICDVECAKNKNDSFYDNIDFCNINYLPNSIVDVNSTWDAAYMHAMKWRWFPIGDSFVDYFISRDLDAWLVQREVDSVKVWMNSSTLFHVMRDHPLHRTQILGGLWGHGNARNRSQADFLFSLIKNKTIANFYYNGSLKGRDQHFLRDYFYKYALVNGTIHDSYHCKLFNGSSYYPTQRSNVTCYLSCYNCCDEKHTKKLWPHKCPVDCRPPEHKDWEYC